MYHQVKKYILYNLQVTGSDDTVLQAVLACDRERLDLLEEENRLLACADLLVDGPARNLSDGTQGKSNGLKPTTKGMAVQENGNAQKAEGVAQPGERHVAREEAAEPPLATNTAARLAQARLCSKSWLLKPFIA